MCLGIDVIFNFGAKALGHGSTCYGWSFSPSELHYLSHALFKWNLVELRPKEASLFATMLPQQRPFFYIENSLARRCAPSALPLVDDVVKTSEMARQNGKEISYPQHCECLVAESFPPCARARGSWSSSLFMYNWCGKRLYFYGYGLAPRRRHI
jgi:hypothetical protein